MGLYDTLQEKIKSALNSSLLDAYVSFTVTNFSSEVYDAVTGTKTAIETVGICKGVVIKNTIGDDLDNPESVEGFSILVMDSDKPFELSVGQKILHGIKNYKVVGVKTDPVNATWTLNCISWKL